MDIQDKTKEQLITDLQELKEENQNLKSLYDSMLSYMSMSESGEDEDLIDFSYFELIFNTSPDMAIIARLSDLRVIKVNDGFTKITGYTREEALNNTKFRINILQNPDDRKLLINEINRQGSFENIETTLVRKDGTTFRSLVSAKLFQFQGEQYVSTISRDITNIRNIENQLKESETNARVIMEATNEILMLLDNNAIVVDTNEAHAKRLGLNRDDIVGKNIFDLLPQKISKSRYAYFKQVIETGKSIQFEDYRDGYWNEVSYYPLLDKNNETEKVAIYSKDITERKLADKKIKESEMKFRLLFEKSPYGISISNNKGEYIDCNEAGLRDINMESLEELRSFKTKDFYWNEDDRNKLMTGLIQNGYVQDIELAFKSPKREGVNYYLASASMLNIENSEPQFIMWLKNITGRKLAEKALKESEERYHESQLIGNVAHWEYNFGTEKLYWSDQLYNIYEVTKETYEPDLKKVLDFSDIEDQEKIRNLYYNVIENKTDFVLETKIVTQQGNVKYLITKAKLKFDEKGNSVSLLGTVVDITERKKIEEELKNSQEELRNFATFLMKVRENEREEITLEIHDSVAQFLAALKMDMGLIIKKIADDNVLLKSGDVKAKMEQLISDVDKTLKSTRMIMNGLRPDQLELLGIVDAMEVHLHNFEEIHHIKCKFENTATDLNMSKEQSIVLFRIFQESLTNILKHANANSVAVKLTENDGKLVLQIIDNGVGFDEKFIRTTDSYGLISMKEQVKRLDGIFTVTSKPGQGTLVRVEIPDKE